MTAETQKEIRVLIVDDSAFMRKVLESTLLTGENRCESWAKQKMDAKRCAWRKR